jgi:hypothetical protein
LAQGQAVLAIDPFGIGQNVGEQNPEQPRGSTRYFTTFNRVDDAERIYDILLALRYALSTGSRALGVAGFGRAGPWALLAGAILGPQEIQCRFVIDTARFDTAGPRDYLDCLPIPGILRAGGLPNAAALVAPHDLVLHNTGEGFDIAWARAAYALYPGATLAVHKERLRNDEWMALF